MERRNFFKRVGGYAGSVAAASIPMQATQARSTVADLGSSGAAPQPLVLTAQALGAAGDGTGDDGAILTAAIRRRFGSLGSSQSTSPVTIEFGDGRFMYRLQTPIVVQQNHVRLVGRGAILDCAGPHAIVGDHDATSNILFGFVVQGFTLKGTISRDAVEIRSGSQCIVEDIRNYAAVSGAVVHYTGVTSSRTSGVKSDGQFGASCRHVIRESVYEKAGAPFNCIANRHADLVGFGCSDAGVRLVESDAFTIAGDLETCDGPGVHLTNCRFGVVSIYAERNGMGASNSVGEPADDILVDSGDGRLISRSGNLCITHTVCGGEQMRGRPPNNVHIAGADDCLIIHNALAGNIRIDPGCRGTQVGAQMRFIGRMFDQGSGSLISLQV